MIGAMQASSRRGLRAREIVHEEFSSAADRAWGAAIRNHRNEDTPAHTAGSLFY